MARFNLVVATHNTDDSAYYIGIGYRVSGAGPVLTPLAQNKITTGATNAGGTVVFKYNGDSSDPSSITSMVYHLY